MLDQAARRRSRSSARPTKRRASAHPERGAAAARALGAAAAGAILAADLVDQLARRRRWRHVQLVRQPRAQLRERGERGRAVAGLGQAPDQLAVHVLRERVVGGLAARPANRRRQVAGLLRGGRQPPERAISRSRWASRAL